MLLKIQKYRLTRYIWLLIAFHFINLSIDVEYDNRSFSTIGLNEQESIVELVLEKIIGLDNIIPEQEHDDDTDDFRPTKIELAHFKKTVITIDIKEDKLIELNKTFNNYLAQFVAPIDYKINTPPPEII